MPEAAKPWRQKEAAKLAKLAEADKSWSFGQAVPMAGSGFAGYVANTTAYTPSTTYTSANLGLTTTAAS